MGPRRTLSACAAPFVPAGGGGREKGSAFWGCWSLSSTSREAGPEGAQAGRVPGQSPHPSPGSFTWSSTVCPGKAGAGQGTPLLGQCSTPFPNRRGRSGCFSARLVTLRVTKPVTSPPWTPCSVIERAGQVHPWAVPRPRPRFCNSRASANHLNDGGTGRPPAT